MSAKGARIAYNRMVPAKPLVWCSPMSAPVLCPPRFSLACLAAALVASLALPIIAHERLTTKNSQATEAVAVGTRNWSRFRGPAGQGVAAETETPLEWNGDNGLVWAIPLPGPGASSPVTWNDRI